MKKFILMALFAATFSFAANAQTNAQAPATDAEMAAKKHKYGSKKAAVAMGIKKQLGLSNEQMQKFKTLNSTYKGKFQAIRTDNSLSKEQKKAQMQEVKTAYDGEMKALLTPEQYAKWTEMKKQAKAKMKNRPAGSKMKPNADDAEDMIPMDDDGK